MQLYDLSLNFADILLILPLVLFSFFSFFRGFVSELLSLLLWVFTYFCSIFLHSIFIDQLPNFGINKDIFSSIVIIILLLIKVQHFINQQIMSTLKSILKEQIKISKKLSSVGNKPGTSCVPL